MIYEAVKVDELAQGSSRFGFLFCCGFFLDFNGNKTGTCLLVGQVECVSYEVLKRGFCRLVWFPILNLLILALEVANLTFKFAI